MNQTLTPEQEAKFPEYREKWIKIGLSTEPMDKTAVAEFVYQLYDQENLARPKAIEYYDSPFAAIEAMKKNHGITPRTHDFVFGSHDAARLAFFDFIRTELEIEGCEKIEPLIGLSMTAGWCLFYDELAVVTERPISIKFDADGRTHCEDDLAIKYRDGSGVAVWHGTRIPSQWILDKSSITPEILFNWRNVEERRAACEIVGWARVVELTSSELIDEDSDPTVGALYLSDIPGIGKEKFLIALDPNTNKKVGLPVPPEMETALEANSWTYGIDKFEFKPDVRV